MTGCEDGRSGLALYEEGRSGGGNVPARRRGLVLAGMMFAAVALSACGSSDSSENSDGGGQTKLTVDIGGEPASLDHNVVTDGPADSFIYSVQEGLTARKAGEVTPALAKSWEVDGKTWTFHLREGVKFHDGTELTAPDVVASWKRALQPESQSLGHFVQPDTKVAAPDAQTVTITRPVVDATTPVRAGLIMVVPRDYAATSDKRLSTEMPGTGPYQFVSWDKGRRITLKRFDGYWSGNKPPIKDVELRFSKETAVRLSELQAGEIDMALNMTPDLAESAKDLQTIAGSVSEVVMIRLNAAHGALQDERLREAVNLAIDRPTIIDTVYGGLAESAKGQLFTPAVFGFDESLEDYPFDLPRAQQLVKEAGAEGTKLELSGTRGRWVNDAELTEVIARMLDEAGFTVDLKIRPYAEFIKGAIVAGENDAAAPDMLLTATSNEIFDPSAQDFWLTCEGAGSTFCDKEIDRLTTEGISETDEDARAEIYRNRSGLITEHGALATIATGVSIRIAKPTLVWKPRPDGFMRFEEMRFK